jgi:hypothetical protein
MWMVHNFQNFEKPFLTAEDAEVYAESAEEAVNGFLFVI